VSGKFLEDFEVIIFAILEGFPEAKTYDKTLNFYPISWIRKF
jgi:hypothetical protein